jgi:protein TonB
VFQVRGDDEQAAKERQFALTLQPTNPKRIRVGGQVMSGKLVSKVEPTYPKQAKKAHVQGTVRLEVVIGKNGEIQDIRLVSGDPVLAKAAVEAVSEWRYQPVLLNGEAVEVVTEIDINFTLTKN